MGPGNDRPGPAAPRENSRRIVGRMGSAFMRILHEKHAGELFVLGFACILAIHARTIIQAEQRVVDNALVLLGEVRFPPGSVMESYFSSTWTILTQIASLLLLLTRSEMATSIIVNVFSSLLFYTGLFRIAASISGSRIAGVFISTAMFSGLVCLGSTDYPVFYLSEHSFGLFAYAFFTFMMGEMFAGRKKSLGFCLGVFPAIHAVVGMYCNGVFALVFLIGNIREKSFGIRKLLKWDGAKTWYCIGGLLSILSLVVFLLLRGEVASLGDATYVGDYIKYWDYHRSIKGINYTYVKLTCVFLAALFFLYATRPGIRKSVFFLICFVSISMLLYVFKNSLWIFPEPFVRIMPTRFSSLHSILGATVIASAFIAMMDRMFRKINKESIARYVLPAACVLLAGYVLLNMAGALKAYGNPAETTEGENSSHAVQEKQWDNVRKALEGSVITTSSTSLPVLRRGKMPILLDMTGFDFVPYLPDTSGKVKAILEGVYKIDFYAPPPGVRNRGTVPDFASKQIFQKMQCEEWRAIREQFSANIVAVPKKWVMDLQLLETIDGISLYVISNCGE